MIEIVGTIGGLAYAMANIGLLVQISTKLGRIEATQGHHHVRIERIERA
ncbi:hypothetical protein GCM10007972_27720 [Iodidimonas muriae]|uniref:Uncharacterized protein n=1 Tax=Iodidimonas muriae TaxID=261467 RepID=A0ABQ2LIC1_9PROT|nr:hypothetical protein JCM17843_31230 [Kordiimonadales bacterium JCM 17843]GGO17541.1 hypothetical protein GCM10007972_27720 [Iodidimonas muriae]